MSRLSLKSVMTILSVMICAMILPACKQSVDEPNANTNSTEVGDINMSLSSECTEFLNSLSGNNASCRYNMVEYHLYDKPADNPMQITEVDLSQYMGIGATIPVNIVFCEGSAWLELELLDEVDGPDPLYMPLYAYKKVTGFDKKFYLRTPFNFNNEDNTLNILGKQFNVVGGNKSFLCLTYEYKYHMSSDVEKEFGFSGWHIDKTMHKCTPLRHEDKAKIEFFDSEFDAKIAIIEMIRAKFGSIFNLNDYLYPEIILDKPMVNLDEIEANLRAQQE